MYNLGRCSPVCCGSLYTTGTEHSLVCTVTHMQILARTHTHTVIMSGCTPSACCLVCELSDTTHSLVFVLHKLICFSHFWHTHTHTQSHACAWHSSAPLVCLMLHCAVVMRLGTHGADVILKQERKRDGARLLWRDGWMKDKRQCRDMARWLTASCC